MKVKLIKSLIGSKKDQIATAHALACLRWATPPSSPTTPRQRAR